MKEKPLRIFRIFEIPMFYRYEHYMSISHMALIVNIVQQGHGSNE